MRNIKEVVFMKKKNKGLIFIVIGAIITGIWLLFRKKHEDE